MLLTGMMLASVAQVGLAAVDTNKAGAVAEQRLPSSAGTLRFIENLGQWPENVRFLAEGPTLFVRADCEGLGLDIRTPSGAQFVRLRFEGSRSTVVEGSEPEPGVHNYFVGNDPAHWRGGARAYRRVTYRSLYPGVDLVLRSDNGVPEYDLVFAPNADPSCVRVRIEGLSAGVAHGADIFKSMGAFGALLHVAGASWHAGSTDVVDEVSTVWFVRDDGALGLHVDGRDPARTLIVDPGLVWSTFLGGSAGDHPTDAAFDTDGDLYVTSDTYSPDFPMTAGSYQQSIGNGQSISVTKYRGRNGELVYSSVFGGTGANQRPWAIAVDRDHRAIVVGETRAGNYPTTAGAFDPVRDTMPGENVGFVTTLNPSGTALAFSTILECSSASSTAITDVSIAPTNDIVVCGGSGVGYPVTQGAFQATHQSLNGDGVVTCLHSSGSSLLWSTY